MPLPIILRASALVVLLTSLAGCGPERNQFAPACPTPSLPAVTSDVAFFRPGSSGKDLTDLMFSGRMAGIHGECKNGPDKGTLQTTVSIGIEVARGPALRGNQVEVPVYLAVTDGDLILDKRVFALRGEFPSNVDRLTIGSGELVMILPVTPSKSGAAYSVLAGFQLTPEQLAAVRARGLR